MPTAKQIANLANAAYHYQLKAAAANWAAESYLDVVAANAAALAAARDYAAIADAVADAANGDDKPAYQTFARAAHLAVGTARERLDYHRAGCARAV